MYRLPFLLAITLEEVWARKEEVEEMGKRGPDWSEMSRELSNWLVQRKAQSTLKQIFSQRTSVTNSERMAMPFLTDPTPVLQHL